MSEMTQMILCFLLLLSVNVASLVGWGITLRDWKKSNKRMVEVVNKFQAAFTEVCNQRDQLVQQIKDHECSESWRR